MARLAAAAVVLVVLVVVVVVVVGNKERSFRAYLDRQQIHPRLILCDCISINSSPTTYSVL